MRTEKDKIEDMQFEDKLLYGIYAERAAGNFPLGYKKTDMQA